MIKIKRTIYGEEYEIQLTQEEIEEVRRQDKIQWSKDILANYPDIIPNYGDIMKDNQQLVSYAELLEEKNLDNNGEREIEAIEELFGVTDAVN